MWKCLLFCTLTEVVCSSRPSSKGPGSDNLYLILAAASRALIAVSLSVVVAVVVATYFVVVTSAFEVSMHEMGKRNRAGNRNREGSVAVKVV